ncbi:hypothetical protein BB560_001928 [Smittium megazygosporum]|uniref:CWH43-like N-terminal domain-containing protein n=1 Tax=Smittium megazygosporum TaxID=133381 RepID=A0A2T9ZG65_9FUNG|nr:hypothetical protein BB560_001928 [Smittium megazygosporum]
MVRISSGRNLLSEPSDSSAEDASLIFSTSQDSKNSLKINGGWISFFHTFFALSAFFSALIIGSKLHFLKIVKNEYYGYPDEWFPSVSASIGDRYPERNIFQILIALTCPFRLLLLFLWMYTTKYQVSSSRFKKSPVVLFVIGFVRTVTCGGWVYITSTDDHNIHDITMISYIVLTLPYMIMSTSSGKKLSYLSKINPPLAKKALKYRKITGFLFFGIIIPLIYFFLQHKIYKVAGEWSLIILDVLFDAISIYEFSAIEMSISTTSGFNSE